MGLDVTETVSPITAIARQLRLPDNPQRMGEGGGRLGPAGDLEPQPCVSERQRLPMVSLVTIVLNGAKNLERTINSVLGQSYPNIEYIIVDGGSTDGTVEIIKRYQERLSYWVSERDKGISDAFNKGVSLAQGELVGLINADDWYQPNAVDLVVQSFRRTNNSVIHGKLQFWRDGEKQDLVSGSHTLLQRDMTINHPTVFVSFDLYSRLGGFNPKWRYAMDYDWLLRARAAGAEFIYVDECLANMTVGGVSDKNWKKTIREVFLIKALHSSTKVLPWVSYISHLARAHSRRILENFGLEIVVRFYHQHFSYVAKISQADPRRKRGS